MKFFSDDLANCIQQRLLMCMGDQSFVDQCLIVTPTGILNNSAEIFQYRVIETYGNLGFAGFERHYGTTLGACEINFTKGFSGVFFHSETFGVCWLSKPKSVG